MSDDFWLQFITREPCLAKLTPAALGAAMEGFPLQPRQGMAWLARAIQGVLLQTLPRQLIACEEVTAGKPLDPTRSEMRIAARNLKRQTYDYWSALYRYHRAIPFDINRIERELEVFLDSIAEFEQLDPDPPRWRQRESRDLRIQRAEHLAVVFELAFGTDATVNSWPGSDGGPWPDFYQRIVAVVFGEHVTPDLHEVLKEARRNAIRQVQLFGSDIRGLFSAGILPEYPS